MRSPSSDQHIYHDIILKKIEKTYNYLLPLASVVGLISAVAVYFSHIPVFFVWFNGAIAVIFLLMFLYRKHISIQFKIIVTILTAMSMATASFMDGGFTSSATVLFILANIIAVLFLEKHHSLLLMCLTLIIYGGLWLYSYVFEVSFDMGYSSSIWLIKYIVFALYLIFAQTAVYTIRNHLIENIRALEKSKAQSDRLAYFDQLTGLANTIMFKESVASREVGNHYGIMIFLCIRNLEMINTIYGDRIGDQVLQNLGGTLKRIKDKNMIIGRINGNEIALWMEGKPDEADDKIQWLIEAIGQKTDVSCIQQSLEFYVSYAIHSPAIDWETCYQHGTLALTYAKKHRNQEVVAYNEAFDHVIHREEKLKEALNTAIRQDGFIRHYQPKVKVSTGKVYGVEALSRLKLDELGWVSPIEFIPLIEEINQSARFGELTISSVLNDYDNLCHKYGADLEVSINISPNHLITPGFSQAILAIVKNHQIAPEKIILEITEEILITGVDKVNQILRPLRETGIKVSLDDFGSGYSSLRYLMNLDIDEMKIDKVFIERLLVGEKTKQMIAFLLALADNYQLSVIAEGVETKEQLEVIQALGCDNIQGYYFYKPEPL